MAIGKWERMLYWTMISIFGLHGLSYVFTYGPLFVETWDRYSDKAHTDGAYCKEVCDYAHKYGERTKECADACHNAHSWQWMRATQHVANSFSLCGIDTSCSAKFMDIISSPLGVVTAALTLLGLPALSLRCWSLIGSPRQHEHVMRDGDWQRRKNARYRGVAAYDTSDQATAGRLWTEYFTLKDRRDALPLPQPYDPFTSKQMTYSPEEYARAVNDGGFEGIFVGSAHQKIT